MVLTDADARDLFARLAQIPDPRAKRDTRHSQRSLLAIVLCATISGAQGSTAIREWVQRLSPAMWRRLRCRRGDDGCYKPPSEATLRRMLKAIDIEQLERQLGDWLQTHWAADEPLALDGKRLRGARERGRTRHLVAAFGHHSHGVAHQVEVTEKTGEISAVKPLLDPLPLAGRVVTADALHNQAETARYLVEDRQVHYLFTVAAIGASKTACTTCATWPTTKTIAAPVAATPRASCPACATSPSACCACIACATSKPRCATWRRKPTRFRTLCL
jgi:hypothetical protein